jgi:hypothetical protein
MSKTEIFWAVIFGVCFLCLIPELIENAREACGKKRLDAPLRALTAELRSVDFALGACGRDSPRRTTLMSERSRLVTELRHMLAEREDQWLHAQGFDKPSHVRPFNAYPLGTQVTYDGTHFHVHRPT